MKRLLLLLCLLPLSISPAHADDASKKAKVEDLFATMHLDRLLTEVQQQSAMNARQVVAGMFNSTPVAAADQPLIDDYLAKVQAVSMQTFGWNAIKDEYVHLYTESYTEEELDGILAFYKSPAGQAVIRKSPDLVHRSSEIVQAHMPAFQERFQSLTSEFAASMAARHKSDAPTTAPSPRS